MKKFHRKTSPGQVDLANAMKCRFISLWAVQNANMTFTTQTPVVHSLEFALKIIIQALGS